MKTQIIIFYLLFQKSEIIIFYFNASSQIGFRILFIRTTDEHEESTTDSKYDQALCSDHETTQVFRNHYHVTGF